MSVMNRDGQQYSARAQCREAQRRPASQEAYNSCVNAYRPSSGAAALAGAVVAALITIVMLSGCPAKSGLLGDVEDTVAGARGEGSNGERSDEDAIPVAGISLSQNTLELVSGETAALEATVEPAEASDTRVIWESDDESVITVDSEGVVTAIGPGEAKVKAVTRDGGFTDAAAAEVEVGGILDQSFNGQGFATHPGAAGGT